MPPPFTAGKGNASQQLPASFLADLFAVEAEIGAGSSVSHLIDHIMSRRHVASAHSPTTFSHSGAATSVPTVLAVDVRSGFDGAEPGPGPVEELPHRWTLKCPEETCNIPLEEAFFEGFKLHKDKVHEDKGPCAICNK